MKHNDINEEYETEKNSSIKVSKGMQGKYSFEVKLYWSIEEDEDSILARIKKIYDKLEATYKNE
ncbi:MAG: hypothetical protein ACFFG0_02895 [Candidatus Thorarchaeota archaeon]